MLVDVILLSRDLSPPRPDIWEGLRSQAGVDLVIHRQVGTPQPGDRNRWETIARARSEARAVGSRPWVMFLDDDVVLGPGSVGRLVEGLQQRPEFAALGADSAGEMNRPGESWDRPSHVGMAAVMFRREALAGLTFRWDGQKCECLCCCEDLRAAGWEIGYLPGAAAWHRPASPDPTGALPPSEPRARPQPPGDPAKPTWTGGRILAAFDRRDYNLFRTQFLTTLRQAGNHEPVWAFAYGLYPSERERLAAQPGVTVVPVAHDGVCPALSRLRDFQSVLSTWPDDAPVAYWDAGDILFQACLEPLWDLVASHPGVLLVVQEPKSYPDNPVIRTWTDHIIDPEARARAFAVMSTHLFLNSGFAAGTAGALLDYCREGDRLLHSPALRGVGDWGDQPAMNLYCHAYPERWKAIHSGWNYSLAGQDRWKFRVGHDGRTERADGEPVHVVHGNAGTLRWLELSPWGPAARQGQARPFAAASH